MARDPTEFSQHLLVEESASESIPAAPALAVRLCSERMKLRRSPVQLHCKAARAWRLTVMRKTDVMRQSLLYWTQGCVLPSKHFCDSLSKFFGVTRTTAPFCAFTI